MRVDIYSHMSYSKATNKTTTAARSGHRSNQHLERWFYYDENLSYKLRKVQQRRIDR